MGEVYLSWDGICSHYPNRWVLIARPCDARRADVLGGWVLAHGEEEHEVILAMDLAPIAHDLALVHTDPELAADTPDFVYTLEYLTWRPVFLDDETEWCEPAPPAPRHKRWWQIWR